MFNGKNVNSNFMNISVLKFESITVKRKWSDDFGILRLWNYICFKSVVFFYHIKTTVNMHYYTTLLQLVTVW